MNYEKLEATYDFIMEIIMKYFVEEMYISSYFDKYHGRKIINCSHILYEQFVIFIKLDGSWVSSHEDFQKDLDKYFKLRTFS